MEALCIQLWEKDGVGIKEEEEGKSGEYVEGGLKASTPAGCTTDEETDEDSEPDPPPVVRRKVSFADAFGLDLVSVKEFEDVEAPEPEVSLPSEVETMRPSDEFFMSCLFSVPSSPEELDQRLQEQMVELESIELLPGTTTVRGIIRVVNLSYWKAVYARMSLDRWGTYFDLAAEYVPGSSDRKTDRFSFTYTLVPPFEREGTRVDICLRYDTSVGSFWANNKELNYVLFCHQKGHINEHKTHGQDESTGHRGKRSCLRVNRRGSAEEKTRETSNTSAVVADARATDESEEAKRKKTDRAEIQSVLCGKENKPLVDSIKSRHRAARLARVQNGLAQRRHHVPQAHSHDSAGGQKSSGSFPTPWGDSTGRTHERHKKPANDNLPVLTYHQIPLLTLDWNSDAANQRGAAAHVDDIWTGRSDMGEDNTEDKPSVNDIWEAFCNRADDARDMETSVCNVWQAFLNEPSCLDHSAVPESEWLQTAASVSPSKDKEPQSRYAANSRDYEFQMGTDSPASSGAPQPPSWSSVSLRAEDHQQAGACVSRPRDDNTTASQRSETNSVTDTQQEFSLEGATPVAESPVDGSAECHKQAAWEPEREGIIGGAEGTGGDEAFITHTDDFITSSGESETTDMTATPESKNASRDDRISQGAKQAEGFSSSREGQVTDGVHNAMDDTLAFRGTIEAHTKDRETYAFSTSRRGAEEEVVNRRAEKKASTGEEIFRPQTPECEISQRYADEKQREEVRLNQNSGNPLQANKSDESETRTAQSHADESSANPTRDGNFKEGQIIADEFKSEESESKVVASNGEEIKETEVEPSCCLTCKETKGLIGGEEEIIQVLNEEAAQVDSSWQKGNTSIIPEVHDEQTRPIQTGEELCVREEEEEDSKLTQIEENVELEPETGISKQTDEDKHLSCDGIMKEGQEINPSAQSGHRVESEEMEEVIGKDKHSLGSFTEDKEDPDPAELGVMRWTRSQDDTRGQNEDVAGEISPEDVTGKEDAAKADTSTELQRQPERLEGTEEDMSQRDKDERVSIGELKIDAPGELTVNVGIPQGETQYAPAPLKELPAEEEEVESTHARVECKESSQGTKAITGENTVALDAIETGLEEMLIRQFGEELVRGIWEEVFDLTVQTSSGDTNIVDGIGGKFVDVPGVTQNCHLLFEVDETFDSGIFSLTESPLDPNTSLSRGLEQINASESCEYSPKESNQPLTGTGGTHFLSEPQTNTISSAPLSLELTTVVPAWSRQSFSESDQSSFQETGPQIKERSVAPREPGRQMEECAAAPRKSFNRSEPQCLKSQSPPSERLNQSHRLAWWSILYVLSHITRLLVGAALVVGFYAFISLYDFPVFPSTVCFVIMLVALYVEEMSRQGKQGGGGIW